MTPTAFAPAICDPTNSITPTEPQQRPAWNGYATKKNHVDYLVLT